MFEYARPTPSLTEGDNLITWMVPNLADCQTAKIKSKKATKRGRPAGGTPAHAPRLPVHRPIAVQQVGVDVFVIDPVFAFIFVWSTGLIEGRSVKDEILHTIQYDYPTMVLWLIVIGLCWAPLQIYLFNRYPVQYRVLTADLIDLVWTCVTSFFCHV